MEKKLTVVVQTVYYLINSDMVVINEVVHSLNYNRQFLLHFKIVCGILDSSASSVSKLTNYKKPFFYY